MSYCTGFGWDRINFLLSTFYGVMLCICAENSINNITVVWLFLSSSYTKTISVSHSASPATMHKNLGGNIPAPCDQRDIAYYVML